MLKEYCIVKFNYESEGQIKVFTSLSNKEPSFANYDRRKEGRPSNIKVFLRKDLT